jgi:hypothetical protein
MHRSHIGKPRPYFSSTCRSDIRRSISTLYLCHTVGLLFLFGCPIKPLQICLGGPLKCLKHLRKFCFTIDKRLGKSARRHAAPFVLIYICIKMCLVHSMCWITIVVEALGSMYMLWCQFLRFWYYKNSTKSYLDQCICFDVNSWGLRRCREAPVLEPVLWHRPRRHLVPRLAPPVPVGWTASYRLDIWKHKIGCTKLRPIKDVLIKEKT